MIDCDFDAGLPSAQALAKQLLFQRVQESSSAIQGQLNAVKLEDLAADDSYISLSKTTKTSLQYVVKSALTADDWDSISAAAATAVQKHLIKRVMLTIMTQG